MLRISGLNDSDAHVLEAATRVLRAPGRVVVYPTDTLYALGCRAEDAEAAARVRGAKGRDEAKPLPLVGGSVDQVQSLAPSWNDAARRLAKVFWPGPLTLVLPHAGRLPTEVTAEGATIAIRVPASSFLRDLCHAAGPLVSTSANRSGEPAPGSFDAAEAAVGQFADLLIDGGRLDGVPSTIVDVTGEPRLVRPGRLPWDVILEILKP